MNRLSTAPRSEDYTLRLTYHPSQERLFFGSTTRNKIIAKGRRFGLTRGFANYAIEQMLEGLTPILWVDTINKNIARYVERYITPALRPLPSSFWSWKVSKNELRIGSAIMDLRSADIPENIEGFGYKLILLNEAGIILKDEYLWHNTLRPMMIDFNCPIMAGGTPKGKNLFHRLYAKGASGQFPDWESFHFTTYDNPFLNAAAIEDIVKDMPEAVRDQEIMAQFLDDDSAIFHGYEACIQGELEEPAPGKRYLAGLDLAKHVDWTVLTIMDELRRHVVWFGRIQKRDWPFQKEWIKRNVLRYNRATVWIDQMSVGDVVMDDLKRDGLHVIGFKFSSQSKRELIENLMLAIENREITFPKIQILLDEMKLFEVEITSTGFRYNAPSGFHDDAVISLALAAWGTRPRVAKPGLFVVG